MAEMQFILDATRKGFGVAKPYGDNEHYDVVVDSGGKLWRVQVKSTAATHHRGFSVRSSWRQLGAHLLAGAFVTRLVVWERQLAMRQKRTAPPSAGRHSRAWAAWRIARSLR